MISYHYFINKISYIDEYDNNINDISNNSGKVITVSGSKINVSYFTLKCNYEEFVTDTDFNLNSFKQDYG